jgi:two-component system OmpR family sensor kinase
LKTATPKRITRGLRFRLTLSYALFFTLLLASAGMLFRKILAENLDTSIRDSINQEWAAMKGFLRIINGDPKWFADPEDPDETYIVSRIKRIYLLTNAYGSVLGSSDLYASLGEDTPDEVRATMASKEPTWKVKHTPDGARYLIRSGVVLDDKNHDPYFFALGRPLKQNEDIIGSFTKIYVGLMPIMIFSGCLLGWVIAGRALTPVTEVAQAAQRISGSNLKLRIPTREAGDELDYLIETFNRMIARLESSFIQIRQFSTDVSHELRTPITAIRGQLEVALFTAQDTEQYREAILTSLQDVERLSQIVRALLLLSQAESGQVALHKIRLDLSETARDIIDQFQIPAEEAQIRLVADLPRECPAEVDRVQIERMISNLISNAVKFTPPGGEVRVSVQRRPDRTDLIVEDTGRGISPEHLSHIFDRFYQVRDGDSNGERGLGLGLSFVSWIAKAHGGSVSVDSELNKGSKFTVSLPPLAESSPDQLASQPSGAVTSA